MVTKDSYSKRKFFLLILTALVWIAFAVRLFVIQVVDDKYKLVADNTSIRNKVILPARGLIYDRNGVLMVSNERTYDLMVIAKEVVEPDTTELCWILGIKVEDFREKLKEASKTAYTRVKPFVFEKQVSKDRINILQEKIYKFPGFYIQERTLRNYPMPIAAHTLGYIGEVNLETVQSNPYYESGDYIGISGIERSYEEALRGKKGVHKILRDKFNVDQGSFMEGKYDIQAKAGMNLYASLDAELQAYGEQLLQNKIGSIVAIEPSSGEILAFVTSPTYDPNLLSGRDRAKNYYALMNDELKPLMNRALQAQYPPGSTFKIANALVGQQMGTLSENKRYSCHGGFHLGGLTVGCHAHISPVNLAQSIQHSCNAYYCWAFRDMIDKNDFANTKEGYNAWRDHILTFGFGQKFGNDLPFELKGLIPTTDYYDKIHRGRWKALSVISLSIGQGEILTTPVQLANLAAIVANRGYYYTPHIIKAIGEPDSLNSKFLDRHYTSVDRQYYEAVVEGMRDVVLAGTARNAYIDSISICGKTGTAQNPHGDNHSLFIAFAPMDNPKIAIAVIVENAGYGTTWAAPIASLMVEKYLNRKVKREYLENHISNSKLIN